MTLMKNNICRLPDGRNISASTGPGTNFQTKTVWFHKITGITASTFDEASTRPRPPKGVESIGKGKESIGVEGSRTNEAARARAAVRSKNPLRIQPMIGQATTA